MQLPLSPLFSRKMFSVYKQEHAFFKENLYFTQLYDEMWEEMELMLELNNQTI